MNFVGDTHELKTYNYLNMVNKLAWEAWRQLPLHTRSWIGVEDIILDGMRWIEMRGLKRWNPKRSQLGTFLYLGVGRHFQSEYVQKYVPAYKVAGKRRGTEKRCEKKTISIQDREQQCRDAGMDFELETALGLPIAPQKEIEREFTSCLVVDNVSKLYQQAPEKLQEKIQEWFLGSASWQRTLKWHTGTQEFRQRAKEFRRLAAWQGVTIQDCRHLLTSPKCLDQLSRELTWLPFNFQYPVGARP